MHYFCYFIIKFLDLNKKILSIHKISWLVAETEVAHSETCCSYFSFYGNASGHTPV